MKLFAKWFVLIVSITICITLYFYLTVYTRTTDNVRELANNRHDNRNLSEGEMHEKWIVITTVSAPSEDIRKMAEIADWRIVVVADKKTPENWAFKNCLFLSIEKQKSLNYEILNLVPYDSYTRKMIGYLYAVQHGAKYIYDTDDDNLPIKLGLDSFDFSNVTSGLVFRNPHGDGPEFFNVYSHFGRPDIWPRGFPLELINPKLQPQYDLCSKVKTPIIQQGLVDKDADVDAIYRMVFVENKAVGLNVTFDSTAPPVVLPKNVFCPFNSQNTLFHYNAFWALLLPTTVTFRVTDIWRGYWAQRLLHLTNNYLGFYPPNARQNRNAHNYHKDFVEERQLYSDTSKLVEGLQQWHCKLHKFSDCIIDLSKFMYLNNFWGYNDLRLTEAWIKDLSAVGYRFPDITDKEDTTSFTQCRNADFVSNLSKKSQKSHEIEKINDFCHPFLPSYHRVWQINERKLLHTKNVNLVVVINKDKYAHIPLLQMLYEPWYANVIFCANFKPGWLSSKSSTPFEKLWSENDRFTFINLSDHELQLGTRLYMCLNVAGQMRFLNTDGYLVIADDMIINVWNSFDVDIVQYPNSCWPLSFTFVDFVKDLAAFKTAFKTAIKIADIRNKYANLFYTLKTPFLHCASDIYYVPQKLLKKYQVLSKMFFDHTMYMDYAVPQIMYLLGWTNETNIDEVHLFNGSMLTGKYFWSSSNKEKLAVFSYIKNRGGITMFDYYKQSDIFLHPLKWSWMNDTAFKAKFCRVYVSTLIESVT